MSVCVYTIVLLFIPVVLSYHIHAPVLIELNCSLQDE